MTLSDISIKNPVFAWMLMFALIIFGFIAYLNLGVGQLPDVDFPVVSVTLTWQGAAPEVMESDIVDIIEDAVMSVEGVKTVSSSMQQGLARITIEFVLGRNIDAALEEVQTKIAQAQRYLPPQMDPPILAKVNPEDQPIMFISISSEVWSLRDIIVYVHDYLKDQFSTISGVGDIVLGGYLDPNLRIWIDEKKLEQYQITADDVINTVYQQHQEVPAGLLQNPKKEANVRIMGEALTPEEFGNIIIEKRAGTPVFNKIIRIKDVAKVEKGLTDQNVRISFTGGKTSIGLGLRKQRGSNEVEVSRNIIKKLKEIKQYVPKEIQLDIAMNRTKFIEDSINELMFTLILSALVTSLICWLFLGSWSATINILLAIPTSILGTFLVIKFFGFTLNTFTVLGLSLAVGIVVDDAIMVLENIVRYQENGHTRHDAAKIGARQITFAALAASIALVAIFLPVAFMSGIIGKFFYQYGVTISIAVLLSLLEALTLTPMRCSQFLSVKPRDTWLGRGVENSFHYLAGVYKKALGWVLNHRGTILIITAVFFLLSLLLIIPLRKEFIPAQDINLIMIRLQTAVDSSIDFTADQTKQIEAFVLSRPEIDHDYCVIGSFTGGQDNQGQIMVTLKDPDKRPILTPFKHRPKQIELMAYFRKELAKRFPNVQCFIQDLSQTSFTAQRGFPIEFNLRGPDWNKLADLTQQFMQEMKKSGLMTDVNTDFLERVKEIHIIPNRFKAANMGVDVITVGNVINNLIGGQPIGKYTENGSRYDIRIRLIPTQRLTAADILRLQIWNNRGELVRLSEVVDVKIEPTSLIITRIDRERAISIFGNVAQGKSQTTALNEVQNIAKRILPPQYHIVLSGSSLVFKEAFSGLLIVLFLGIIVAYMVLGSQFNSYIHPVSVLIALPFSISGAFIALFISNQSLNVYSFIGIILLMGIVKKNSILLVDFTNQFRFEKYNVHEALLHACPIRLRPILMTSIATISAAIPPALGIGPGAESRVPMAAAVIGGVIFSTFLTLFVVPCVYSYFSYIERKDYSKDEDAPERLMEGGQALVSEKQKVLDAAKIVPSKPKHTRKK